MVSLQLFGVDEDRTRLVAPVSDDEECPEGAVRTILVPRQRMAWRGKAVGAVGALVLLAVVVNVLWHRRSPLSSELAGRGEGSAELFYSRGTAIHYRKLPDTYCNNFKKIRPTVPKVGAEKCRELCDAEATCKAFEMFRNGADCTLLSSCEKRSSSEIGSYVMLKQDHPEQGHVQQREEEPEIGFGDMHASPTDDAMAPILGGRQYNASTSALPTTPSAVTDAPLTTPPMPTTPAMPTLAPVPTVPPPVTVPPPALVTLPPPVIVTAPPLPAVAPVPPLVVPPPVVVLPHQEAHHVHVVHVEHVEHPVHVVHVEHAEPPVHVVHVEHAEPPVHVVHVEHAEPPVHVVHVEHAEPPVHVVHVEHAEPPVHVVHVEHAAVPPPPRSDPFDCKANIQNWETAWPQEQKAWCCTYYYDGCPDGNHYDEPVHHVHVVHVDGNHYDEPVHHVHVVHVERPANEIHHVHHVHHVHVAELPPPPPPMVEPMPPMHEHHHVHIIHDGHPHHPHHYDCRADIATWETSWSPGKKDWCCNVYYNGCPSEHHHHEVIQQPAYDCEAGVHNWRKGWSFPKKNYCCHHHSVGCPHGDSIYPEFDCEAGKDNAEKGWSDQKKAWCCVQAGKACVEHIIDHVDCGSPNEDMRSAWNAWSDEKQAFCCIHHGVACPAPPTTTTPWAQGPVTTTTPFGPKFDCEADHNTWVRSWSEAKKEWCCEHEHKGCVPFTTTTAYGQPGFTTTTPFNYDCDAGLANWEAGWSEMKKAHCCKTEQKGCGTNQVFTTTTPFGHAEGFTTTTPFPNSPETTAAPWDPTQDLYDCDAAFDNWQAAWSPEKKAWCCKYEMRGCGDVATTTTMRQTIKDPFDCCLEESSMWSPKKMEWCCKYKDCCTTRCKPLCAETTPFPETTTTPFGVVPQTTTAPFPNGNIETTPGGGEEQTTTTPFGIIPKEEQTTTTPFANQGTTDAILPEWTTTTAFPNGILEEAFDCNAGLANWERGWSPEKKQWCCINKKLGCEGETTPHPEPTTTMPFPPQAQEWTTTTAFPNGILEEAFDCNAGLSNWHRGWSPEKKRWCCINKKLGCEGQTTPSPEQSTTTPFPSKDDNPWDSVPSLDGATTTTPMEIPQLQETTTTGFAAKEFDCNAGLPNWKAGWSPEKKTWCCSNHQLGCEDVQTTTTGFDTKWSTSQEEVQTTTTGFDTKWFTDKQTSLMTTLPNQETTTTGFASKQESPHEEFDCNAGLPNWKAGWSPAKKTWCCSTHQLGCEDGQTTTTGFDTKWSTSREEAMTTTAGFPSKNLAFDCDAGLANWKAGWSDEKKTWCCSNHQLGCEDGQTTTTGFDTKEATTREEVMTTTDGFPSKNKAVESTTGLPDKHEEFDCDAGLARWKAGWSPAKKMWCCAMHHKGCEQEDTTTTMFDTEHPAKPPVAETQQPTTPMPSFGGGELPHREGYTLFVSQSCTEALLFVDSDECDAEVLIASIQRTCPVQKQASRDACHKWFGSISGMSQASREQEVQRCISAVERTAQAGERMAQVEPANGEERALCMKCEVKCYAKTKPQARPAAAHGGGGGLRWTPDGSSSHCRPRQRDGQVHGVQQRVRKEATGLTEQEWSRLSSALRTLKSNGKIAEYARLFSEGLPPEDPTFLNFQQLPWYRRFIHDFETDLQVAAKDCDLTLPYWSSCKEGSAGAMTASDVWSAGHLGGRPSCQAGGRECSVTGATQCSGDANRQCLEDGIASGWRVSSGAEASGGCGCVHRSPGDLKADEGTCATVLPVFRLMEDFKSLTEAIDSLRANMLCGEVAGSSSTLCAQETTVWDPLFWLDYAYLDRLFFSWQRHHYQLNDIDTTDCYGCNMKMSHYGQPLTDWFGKHDPENKCILVPKNDPVACVSYLGPTEGAAGTSYEASAGEPAPPGGWDCDAGLANWVRGWSPAKKAWCCKNHHKGCSR